MRKILNAILGNLDLKIAAAVLAVVTWYYIATGGLVERRFEKVAVRVVKLPRNIAVLSLDVSEVTILLNGPRGELDRLEGRPLVAAVDLSGVTLEAGAEEKRSIQLDGPNVHIAVVGDPIVPLPYDVHLVRAEPAALPVTLNTETSRDLPVEVVLRGSPAPEFALKTTVIPQTVAVRGPLRLLQTLSSIRTEPVPVDGLRERTRRTVRLEQKVSTKEYGTVAVSPQETVVDVVLDVMEKPEEKTVQGVAVRVAGLPESLAVMKQTVREVAITLRGPERLIRDLDAQSLVVDISLKEEQPPAGGPEEMTYHILPEHIRRLTARGESLPLAPDIERQAEPRVIRLTLDRLASRELPVKPVLDGTPAEDHEVSEVAVLPPKVVVQGPQSVVDRLDALETLPVSVAGLKENFRRTVGLSETVDAGDLGAVRIAPSQRVVDVVVTVAEHRIRKTLASLPVRVLATPGVAVNIRVELDPRAVGPVEFIGPASAMEQFGPDSVVAFVRLDISSAADLRPTIKNVEFHVNAPQVHRADGKPIPVKIEFLPVERQPEAPAPKP